MDPPTNLARLDLNQLVALDALLRYRNVTRAAEHLVLTQPALSASLARLRRHFDDELLVRVRGTYRLTPLAEVLEERARAAVAALERVFEVRSDLDPARTTREYVLLVTDYALTLFGGAICSLLAAEAPHARLRFEQNSPAAVAKAERLLQLSHDLMIMPHGEPMSFSYTDLFHDTWVVVVATDSPLRDDEVSLAQLSEFPWVASFQGRTASTPAARQLHILGVEPRVQVRAESFLAVPGLVAGSDRVSLLQRRLFDRLPADSGVRELRVPWTPTPMVQAMWWHPTRAEDPEHLYLRDLVQRAVAQAVEPGPSASAPDLSAVPAPR